MLILLACSSDFAPYIKSQMYTLSIYSFLLKKRPWCITSLIAAVGFIVWKPLREPSF